MAVATTSLPEPAIQVGPPTFRAAPRSIFPFPSCTPAAGALSNLAAGVGPSKGRKFSSNRPFKRTQSAQENEAVLARNLWKYWRHSSFREHQLEICMAALRDRDVLVVAPTGNGKSLCFQLPAITLEYGVTIVVTPIKSLMHDQVNELKGRKINAMLACTDTSPADRRRIITQLNMGHPQMRLLYITPESLFTQTYNAALTQAYKNRQLRRLVVDEAHCIDEWGFTFRNTYRKLGRFRHDFPTVPITALTASATKGTRADIIATLGIERANLDMWVLPVNRSNLFYEIVYRGASNNHAPASDFITEHIKKILPELQERNAAKGVSPGVVTGIVYCRTTLQCEEMAYKLRENKITARHFHAKMSDAEKAEVLDQWKNGKVSCVCATVAFGMGIDQPHVRYVIHYNLPRSFEGYYQETGRAGRDGHMSRCILIYSRDDARYLLNAIERDRNRQLSKEGPEAEDTPEKVAAFQRQLDSTKWLQANYVEKLQECRHVQICRYFGEKVDTGVEGAVKAYCNDMCDICKNSSAVRRAFSLVDENIDPASQVVRADGYDDEDPLDTQDSAPSPGRGAGGGRDDDDDEEKDQAGGHGVRHDEHNQASSEFTQPSNSLAVLHGDGLYPDSETHSPSARPPRVQDTQDADEWQAMLDAQSNTGAGPSTRLLVPAVTLPARARGDVEAAGDDSDTDNDGDDDSSAALGPTPRSRTRPFALADGLARAPGAPPRVPPGRALGRTSSGVSSDSIPNLADPVWAGQLVGRSGVRGIGAGDGAEDDDDKDDDVKPALTMVPNSSTSQGKRKIGLVGYSSASSGALGAGSGNKNGSSGADGLGEGDGAARGKRRRLSAGRVVLAEFGLGNGNAPGAARASATLGKEVGDQFKKPAVVPSAAGASLSGPARSAPVAGRRAVPQSPVPGGGCTRASAAFTLDSILRPGEGGYATTRAVKRVEDDPDRERRRVADRKKYESVQGVDWRDGGEFGYYDASPGPSKSRFVTPAKRSSLSTREGAGGGSEGATARRAAAVAHASASSTTPVRTPVAGAQTVTRTRTLHTPFRTPFATPAHTARAGPILAETRKQALLALQEAMLVHRDCAVWDFWGVRGGQGDGLGLGVDEAAGKRERGVKRVARAVEHDLAVSLFTTVDYNSGIQTLLSALKLLRIADVVRAICADELSGDFGRGETGGMMRRVEVAARGLA